MPRILPLTSTISAAMGLRPPASSSSPPSLISMAMGSTSRAPGSLLASSLTLLVIAPMSSVFSIMTASTCSFQRSMASGVRFWMKGMAPLAPMILPSLSIPLWVKASTACPVMCPLTSIPVTRTNLILGLAMTLATIFSMPMFSVLQGPARAAPALIRSAL